MTLRREIRQMRREIRELTERLDKHETNHHGLGSKLKDGIPWTALSFGAYFLFSFIQGLR